MNNNLVFISLVTASLFLLISIGNTVTPKVMAFPSPQGTSHISETNASMFNMSKPDAGILTLTIFSDYNQYVDEFQTVILTAQVGKQKGHAILILEARNSSGALEVNQSKLTGEDEEHFYFYPGNIGVHNVTVSAIQNGNVVHTSTTYEVISFWNTVTMGFLLASLSSFGALLVLIGVSKTDSAKAEILRFVFLSGIVISILGALFFIQVPYGTISPVGLVTVNSMNQNTDPFTAGAEWKFKVGGQLYIPIYVIVFGLLGGYLRYLYKTSRLVAYRKSGRKTEDIRIFIVDLQERDRDQKQIFFESLQDIALFVLAPLLATAAWFLLSQWQAIAGSPYLLAVISFAAGLITTEIVESITDFTRKNLSKRTSSTGAM